MPSDPWGQVPNLSHARASSLEESRAGDPGRFFAPAHAGEIDVITGRILNVPRASIYRAAAIPNLVANTLTKHIFDTSEYDTDGMWDSNVPDQLTMRTSGLYECRGLITFGSDPTASYRLCQLVRNAGLASASIFGASIGAAATNAGNQQSSSWQIAMQAGDTLTFWVQSGVALAVGVATAFTRSNGLQAVLVSTFGSDNQ